MKTIAGSALVLCASVCTALSVAAQPRVGALAIDERQGDQYGWAVDYETASSAQSAALRECGAGCSVVLTFGRCAAYAADQDADSTAVGWAESFASADSARQAALSECGSRDGTECIVRVWGCNSHVVEEGLGLDRAARREVQEGLQAAGFDPGGADGMFGARTRTAIRSWQASRGVRATGYLDGASMAALRASVAGQPTFSQREPQPQSSPAATAELEGLFWQSIMNSQNPAEFEAYLAQFPNGVFRALAEARLAVLGSTGGNAPASARSGVGGAGSPPGAGTRPASGVDARPSPGAVFRPEPRCAADQPGGASCWMEIAERPGCHVWNPNPQPDEIVTWTGECSGGLAQGTGTTTWFHGGGEEVNTGRRQDGKPDGYTIIRSSAGDVLEGLYVNGERHGDWTIRWTDGETSVYRYENGELVGIR